MANLTIPEKNALNALLQFDIADTTRGDAAYGNLADPNFADDDWIAKLKRIDDADIQAFEVQGGYSQIEALVERVREDAELELKDALRNIDGTGNGVYDADERDVLKAFFDFIGHNSSSDTAKRVETYMEKSTIIRQQNYDFLTNQINWFIGNYDLKDLNAKKFRELIEYVAQYGNNRNKATEEQWIIK